MLLRSPPNPRLTPLGFGGDPDWDGHAAPGGRVVLRRLMQALIAAAAAHPGEPGSPGPRRRKVRLAPFPPAAKTAPAPLLLRSPPNPRLTPLGFGGDPDWGGHAAPGGRAVLRRLMQALIAAAAAHPEVPGWPGPAWPGRTGSGCCSWCKPSSRRPRRCRGWWILHPGCSPAMTDRLLMV